MAPSRRDISPAGRPGITWSAAQTQRPGGDEISCHGLVFLAGLKDAAQRSGKFPTARGQTHYAAQQDRHVDIVAAGVHHARMLRRKSASGTFLPGERVDVRPEQDLLSLPFFAFDEDHRIGLEKRRQELDAGDPGQSLPDEGRSLELLSRDLGDPVEPVTQLRTGVENRSVVHGVTLRRRRPASRPRK